MDQRVLLLSFGRRACRCGGRRAAATAHGEGRRPKPSRRGRAARVESRPIDRYLRVTGSLVADEQAEVSAETAGRVIAMPVERGTRVAQGAVLVRISADGNVGAAAGGRSQRGTDRGAARARPPGSRSIRSACLT